MSNTKTVYRFDSAGYYLGTSLAQYVGDDLLLPSDCTETQPKQKDGYWSKWNGKKWENEKIPTSCAECIEQKFTCISNSPDRHEQEKKAIIESLVNADSEHYKTVVNDSFVMSIEEIPEKTLEEVKAEKLEELAQVTALFENNLNKDMYFTSSLGFRVNGDRRTRSNIEDLIAFTQTFPVAYRDYDNQVQEVTREQLQTMLAEHVTNGNGLYEQKWNFEAQINACTTKEEVEAIKIEFKMMDFSKSTTPRLKAEALTDHVIRKYYRHQQT